MQSANRTSETLFPPQRNGKKSWKNERTNISSGAKVELGKMISKIALMPSYDCACNVNTESMVVFENN